MVLAWIVETVVYVYEGYRWTLTFADQRVEDWPLMDSPSGTAALTALYLAVSCFGPKLMIGFPAFQLRSLLIAYNALMVAFNAYILIEVLAVALSAGYDFTCEPVDYSSDPMALRMAAVLWWFYISKLVEFCDTIFFILRKKSNQLTFLHVYHHSTMFCFWWIGIKWVAGGSSFMGALLNSFVHVLMYGYYALAAAFPKTDFWWKRCLTVIQMIQFNVAIILTVRGLRVDCPFPRWMGYTLIGYMISFVVLFGNFWYQSYSNGRRLEKNQSTCNCSFYDAISPRKTRPRIDANDAGDKNDKGRKRRDYRHTNGFLLENGAAVSHNLYQRRSRQ